MIPWAQFMLLATVLYGICIFLLAFLCLPKLRSNIRAYLCQGQKSIDQQETLSDE